MRKRYIQDPVTLKLVPAELYVRRSNRGPEVQEDIEPFRSHIDGTIISSRSQLREHNRRHGVVNIKELESEWRIAKEKREAFLSGKPHDTASRLDAIRFAVEIHKAGRSKADTKQMVENYRRYNDGR